MGAAPLTEPIRMAWLIRSKPELLELVVPTTDADVSVVSVAGMVVEVRSG